MCVQNVVPIHPIDVGIFHSICKNFELQAVLHEKLGNHPSQRDLSSGHHG